MEKKRPGRPPNSLRSETRIPFNIRVTQAVKDVVEQQAKAKGHTPSQEVVRLIELGLKYERDQMDARKGPISIDDVIDRIRVENALRDIVRAEVEQALRERS
ncbi:MAG: hypothetical protein EPN98_07765 [Phenylobacterium sp.]|uniref:hypothetical protein n=1 Tax=Phenylobacterium sp. TaxID=1871053 RepID=UPI0012002E72|nr:hypothetical protein [Phenylobacterium sp.]TAL34945.1 MAG: hypothetical protein EPN98_07765 [Phenylobacterium sp.]